MAIQTTITVRPNNSLGGTTSIRGAVTGDIGRTVVLSATPAKGYEFTGWEITRKPAALPVSLYPNVTFGGNSISNVCYDGRRAEIGQVLYADGNVLYEDPDRVTIARTGYWEVSSTSNEYIYIVNGRVNQRATCPGNRDDSGGDIGVQEI